MSEDMKWDYKIPILGSRNSFSSGSVKAKNREEALKYAKTGRLNAHELNFSEIELTENGTWADFQNQLDLFGCD